MDLCFLCAWGLTGKDRQISVDLRGQSLPWSLGVWTSMSLDGERLTESCELGAQAQAKWRSEGPIQSVSHAVQSVCKVRVRGTSILVQRGQESSVLSVVYVYPCVCICSVISCIRLEGLAGQSLSQPRVHNRSEQSVCEWISSLCLCCVPLVFSRYVWLEEQPSNSMWVVTGNYVCEWELAAYESAICLWHPLLLRLDCFHCYIHIVWGLIDIVLLLLLGLLNVVIIYIYIVSFILYCCYWIVLLLNSIVIIVIE